MDLMARKYRLIEQLFAIDKESILDAIERMLKNESEESQEISEANKAVLDKRLEAYKNNPDGLLDWEDVKNDW